MSAIAYLAEGYTEEVDAGGLRWRVERVTNALPAERRGLLTIMALPKTPADHAVEEDIRARHTDADGRVDELAIARDLTRTRHARLGQLLLDPMYQERLNANRRALVRVAVVAVQIPARGEEPAGPWEPIRLVEAEAEADASASPPRVWEGRLTGQTVEALFAAAWSLCTDGGAAVERIERFRHRGG